MPPITKQQPAVYEIREITDVPNGAAPAYEDVAAPLFFASKSLSPGDYDRYVRMWKASPAIRALIGVPVAGDPVITPDPDVAGAKIIRMPYAGGLPEFISGATLASNTGSLVTHLGGEFFRWQADPAFRALTDQGVAVDTSFQARAVMKHATHREIVWPLVTIPTTGTKVPAPAPGPAVIAQPSQRSFAEGVQTAFTEDLKVFFSGEATPLFYEVLNSDGTALTGFTLSGVANGVASLISPSTGSGLKSALYRATDANGKTAIVSPQWNVVANPLPVFLSTPPDRDLAVTASGFVETEIATLVSDSEALTVSYVQDDGSALPAGYSSSVVGSALRLTYPTDSAQTLVFRAKAVEQGALARTVLSGPFNVVRTAAAISTAAPITVPENATTRKIIDLGAIIAGATNYSITGAGGGALPANYNVVSIAAGVATVDMNFSNNEIASHPIEYHGDAVTVPTTWGSAHNPPVAGVVAISALNDAPVVLNLSAQSDDGANLIEVGSVFTTAGAPTLAADRKSVSVDPQGFEGVITGDYVLRAPDDTAPVAASFTVDFQPPVAPQWTQEIFTTSVDGTPMPAVNLLQYLTAGSYAIDAARLEFSDISGNALGTTQFVQGVGTFQIDAVGLLTKTLNSGFVGATTLYVVARDIKGRPSDAATLTDTQTASNVGQPWPNILDGKPVIGGSIGHWGVNLTMERALNNEWFYFGTHDIIMLDAAGTRINARELVEQGLMDVASGRITMPPGSSLEAGVGIMQYGVRFGLQNNGYSALDTGKWVVKARTGGSIQMTAQGFTPEGGGAGVTRLVRTLTGADTSFIRIDVTNPGAAAADLYLDYRGLETGEADPRGFRDHFKTFVKGHKAFRMMDAFNPGNSTIYFADEYLLASDFWMHGLTNKGTMASNRFDYRAGFNPGDFYQLAADTSRTLWGNIPLSLGFGAVEKEHRAVNSGNFQDPAVVALDAAMTANIDAIELAVYQQHLILANRFFQAMADKGVPDWLTQIVELGLESFNAGTFSKNWALARAVAIARGLTGTQFAQGTGWIHHIVVRAWLAARAAVKPNQLFFLTTGMQGPSPSTTDHALRGWQAYGARNPSLAAPIKECAICSTGYWSGFANFKADSAGSGNAFNAADQASFDAAFIAEANAGTLFDTYQAWATNPANTGGRISPNAIIKNSKQHKAFCDAAGATYIGHYEGGIGTKPSAAIRSALSNADNLVRDFKRSPQGYACMKHLIDSWFADPELSDKILMNYEEIGRGITPSGNIDNWFEKYADEINVLVPNTISAAWDEAKTNVAGGGGGSGGGGTYAEIDRTIVAADTTALLAAEGFSIPSGSSIALQAGVDALLVGGTTNNGATDLKEMSVRVRPSSPLNANLELELDFLAIAPQYNNTYASFFLQSISTGTKVHCGIDAAGDFNIAAPGDKNIVLLTTAGVDFLDGAWHRLKIKYFIHRTAGVIEVRDRITNALLGSFSGDTNPLAVANLNIDGLIVRGRRYVARIKGVTP